jgi:hypothetical protein
LNPASPTQTRESICGPTRRNITTAQDVGVATAVVGGVFVGAALVHLIATSNRSTEGAGHTARAEHSCAPGLGGFVCYGSF